MIDGPGHCKCVEHIDGERWHGTSSGYNYHGCRCESCSDDHGKRMAAYAEKPEARASSRARGRQRYLVNREAVLLQNRRWYQENRAYAKARTMERDRARQAASVKGATRGHARWSSEEDAVVLSTIPLAEKSEMLGRTYDAVVHRGRVLRKALREDG